MQGLKIVPLLLLPLAIFVMMPVVPASATTPRYYIYLYCGTYDYPVTASVSLSFQGHTYTLKCPKYGGELSSYSSFGSNYPGYYSATMVVDGRKVVTTGSFSQSNCVDLAYEYGTYPYVDAYAIWYLYSAYCD